MPLHTLPLVIPPLQMRMVHPALCDLASSQAQMLLNSNSLAYLHHVTTASACGQLSREVAADIYHTSRVMPTTVPASHALHIHPANFAVDTGAALAILGLRNLTDVDLIWKASMDLEPSVAPALVSGSCGSHSASRRGCQHTYGSHSPSTKWFRFHATGTAAQLIDDPTRVGFCQGLKFIAPIQLLAYKQSRLAARGEAKDRIDSQLIKNSLTGRCNATSPRAFCCSSDGSARAKVAPCRRSRPSPDDSSDDSSGAPGPRDPPRLPRLSPLGAGHNLTPPSLNRQLT